MRYGYHAYACWISIWLFRCLFEISISVHQQTCVHDILSTRNRVTWSTLWWQEMLERIGNCWKRLRWLSRKTAYNTLAAFAPYNILIASNWHFMPNTPVTLVETRGMIITPVKHFFKHNFSTRRKAMSRVPSTLSVTDIHRTPLTIVDIEHVTSPWSAEPLLETSL